MEDILFDNALSLLIDSAFDRALPVDDLLLNLAGAAIGFGLEVACDCPDYIDRLLFSEEHLQLQQFVNAFVTRSVQDGIARTAEETGTPVLAVLVLLIIQSYRDVCGEPERASLREYGQALSRFCLRFILLLWSEHPALAGHYRQFVPA